MGLSTAREAILHQIIEAANNDPLIVAIIDYGSSSEGREDEWSDLDLAIYIKDEDLASFQSDWKDWVDQFGTVLLSYTSGVGKPWVIYEVDPMPLRVDFSIHAESEMRNIADLPNSPVSIEAMVIYDDTRGKLTPIVSKIVGQSLAPIDLRATFHQVSGDFWYYLLRTLARYFRRQYWAVRHDFNFIILGNLMALLRIESGVVERWRGSSVSVGIEKAIPCERLSRLNKCLPERDNESLKQALIDTSQFGYEVCRSISAKFEWDWPKELADRVLGEVQTGLAG